MRGAIGGTTNYKHIKHVFNSFFEPYTDMELTFVDAVKNIWQLQPPWLHPPLMGD